MDVIAAVDNVLRDPAIKSRTFTNTRMQNVSPTECPPTKMQQIIDRELAPTLLI